MRNVFYEVARYPVKEFDFHSEAIMKLQRYYNIDAYDTFELYAENIGRADIGVIALVPRVRPVWRTGIVVLEHLYSLLKGGRYLTLHGIPALYRQAPDGG